MLSYSRFSAQSNVLCESNMLRCRLHHCLDIDERAVDENLDLPTLQSLRFPFSGCLWPSDVAMECEPRKHRLKCPFPLQNERTYVLRSHFWLGRVKVLIHKGKDRKEISLSRLAAWGTVGLDSWTNNNCWDFRPHSTTTTTFPVTEAIETPRFFVSLSDMMWKMLIAGRDNDERELFHFAVMMMMNEDSAYPD